MILHADDFECVPDGRFLERASIQAGSTVLTDLDSVLRLQDVGKHIAIPGAADLVTTIVGLVDHGDVTNVTMDPLGQHPNRLSGSLFHPDNPNPVPFRESIHKGRRIAVAGAGLNGETLVTNILHVIDHDTIDLEDDAKTPVSGGSAIINRGDRVKLDDYARHTVANLTIHLMDRTITDGEMTVGGRALISQTARFSALDLGTPVTIPGAGLFVTTIQSYQSNTQVTLATPAQRTVAGGQADIWKTDSRPGIEKLLASLESLEVESADILFSPGVYDFTRIPDFTHPMNAAIGLNRLKNITLRGAGFGITILRLMPQQDLERPDTHLIETRDCKRLTLRDLSLHGAYLTMSKTNEQMHGININEGSEEIHIERVRIFQSAGDGIRLLGRGGNPDTGISKNLVRMVWVDGCQFIQNKRTGIAFQRAVEFVWVRNCYIEMIPPSTDACIDFEPSGNVAPTDIIIDSNLLKHGTRATAVSISGIRGPDPAHRIKFSNNVILGGEIFCTDINQVSIQNNTIVVTDLGTANRIPIQIQRGGDSLIITGNLLVNENPATRAVISLSEVNQRPVTRAMVANNLCFSRSGIGIQCLSSNDIAVQSNMIVATADCNHGILVRSEASAVDNISLRDNDITVGGAGKWEFGILIAADPHDIGQISVTGNSIRKAAQGIVFQHKKFTQTPVCALNQIGEDVDIPLNGIQVLPHASIVVGGGTSRGGADIATGSGRFIAGRGDPENRIAGNVGDIFQRLDGERDKTLYVKESGNGTNTGWIAK